jgi:hypothetical protein
MTDEANSKALRENVTLKEELAALQARVNVLNSPSYHHPSQGFALNASHVPKPR